MKQTDAEKIWEMLTRCGIPIERHHDKAASLSTITVGEEYLDGFVIHFTFDKSGDLDDISADED